MKRIEAQEGPLEALVQVPGSKSISNRVLILAALASGRTEIENLQFSDDSRHMLDCLKRLGFGVVADEKGRRASVEGGAGVLRSDSAAAKGGEELYVGNAGTAARFLPCLAALGEQGYRFNGDPRMRARPMKELLDLLRAQGAQVEGEAYPFSLKGTGLRGGELSIDLTESSQFASGLLMVAPYAQNPCRFLWRGDREQLPYVEMTQAMMGSFGILPERDGALLNCPQGIYESPGHYQVEADMSGAAYFFAAAALLGGKVTVQRARAQSLQGDIRFLKVLQHMGCEFYEDPEGLTLEKEPGRVLKGVDVDMNAFSDQALTLAALAPFCDRPSRIRNIAHSRRQESDRIHAMAKNLQALGVKVEEFPDGLEVTPGPTRAARIETFGDHRVAMAFAILGLKTPGLEIDDDACVSKTFEDFWEQFALLRRA